MNRILVSLLLGWTLLVMQMYVRVIARTAAQDLRERADNYKKNSQTLQNLLEEEKSRNRRYLQKRSENWYQNWKIEVFENIAVGMIAQLVEQLEVVHFATLGKGVPKGELDSRFFFKPSRLHNSCTDKCMYQVQRIAVYQGYLGCNPEGVLHAISLIRSKLESDASTCMDNLLAELEDTSNESVALSLEAQKLVLSSQDRADLKMEHLGAILECLPDPVFAAISNDALVPPRIHKVARTGSVYISNWKTFQNGFNESRRACFDFHALEYHGTTADIVYLFEECVRGDMKDWVYADPDPSEVELQTFFKIILQHTYTKPAEYIRSLTSLFDRYAQISITTVRRAHVVEMTDLISHQESQDKSSCWHYLPRLKTLYSELIRNAYRCLHGSYTNFLDSKQIIELHAYDINRLTTNSTHQMALQGNNITVEDAVYQIKNKVLPTYDIARSKGDDMEQQYENDVLNIQSHLHKAFECIENTQYKTDEISLELSKAYLRCPSRKSKHKALIKKLESELTDVFDRIEALYQTALYDAFQFLDNWRDRLLRNLTVIPKTTPVCQTSCATYAHAQITGLTEDIRLECAKHLTSVRRQMQENVRRAEYLRTFSRVPSNGKEGKLAQQCLHQAILLSYPNPKNFQIDEKNCGEYFAGQSYNQSSREIREFRDCFKAKCSPTWRYILESDMD